MLLELCCMAHGVRPWEKNAKQFPARDLVPPCLVAFPTPTTACNLHRLLGSLNACALWPAWPPWRGVMMNIANLRAAARMVARTPSTRTSWRRRRPEGFMPSRSPRAARRSRSYALPNGTCQELESHVSHGKRQSAPLSNRKSIATGPFHPLRNSADPPPTGYLL